MCEFIGVCTNLYKFLRPYTSSYGISLFEPGQELGLVPALNYTTFCMPVQARTYTTRTPRPTGHSSCAVQLRTSNPTLCGDSPL